MLDEEYRVAMDVLSGMVRTIEALPLDELLETVNRAETIGHLLVVPLDYQRKMDNLRDQRELLTAAMGLARAADGIRTRALEREARKTASRLPFSVVGD